MSSEDFLCARCARHQSTCCQQSDIYSTPGDIRRIEDFTGRGDFYEFRTASNPQYSDENGDPVWRNNVFRPDGTRRVLKQQANGDCTFLGSQGCTLPLEVRPLICRLYPYDYTADGLSSELAKGCPLELLPVGSQLLEVLNISRADAERWHQLLYQEVLSEKSVLTAASPTNELLEQPQRLTVSPEQIG